MPLVRYSHNLLHQKQSAQHLSQIFGLSSKNMPVMCILHHCQETTWYRSSLVNILEGQMFRHCNVINIIILSSSQDIQVPFKHWNMCHWGYADSLLVLYKQFQEFSPLNNYNWNMLTSTIKTVLCVLKCRENIFQCIPRY
jgi:hypothetical protein